jgi:hypothetical protein
MTPGEPVAARLVRLSRAAALAVAGALPFLFALMLYHWKCFGHPLQTGYVHLNDAAYQPWHLGGFLGIRFPDPRAFALSFASPLRGLFALAPFLLLAIPGLRLQFRASRSQPLERALFWFTAALSLGYLYFTASFSYESWGWTTGPRHLTPWVPFLLLPSGLFLESVQNLPSAGGTVWRGVAAGLCAVSVIITGTLSLLDYVPDSVSNAFFGLAIPLFRSGYLPPSLFNFLGIASPESGAILLIVLILAAGLILGLLSSSRERGALAIGAMTAAFYLGVFSFSYRNDDRDRGALNHLRSVWLTPPGATLQFWPSSSVWRQAKP